METSARLKGFRLFSISNKENMSTCWPQILLPEDLISKKSKPLSTLNCQFNLPDTFTELAVLQEPETSVHRLHCATITNVLNSKKCRERLGIHFSSLMLKTRLSKRQAKRFSNSKGTFKILSLNKEKNVS